MPPVILYPIYLTVMGAAALSFTRAFAVRSETPRHMRWALAGMGLDLFGTLAVMLAHRVLGWQVPAALPTVVWWHRRCAYVSTAWMLALAFAGWRRWGVHPWMGRAFLPFYWLTLLLAIAGYWPY